MRGDRKQPASDLRQTLERIGGRGYKAYKDIEGMYGFPGYDLIIDHVQGDPFAAPSAVRVRVEAGEAGFPGCLFSTMARKTGLEDFLARRFSGEIQRCVKGNRGSGKSGLVAIARCGQEILLRTAVEVSPEGVEARFLLGLPAFGRSVAGREAAAMFFEEIPRVIKGALLYRSLSGDLLERRAELVDDQQAVVEALDALGLVAFVMNGSVLPRRSGVSDEPMSGQKVVPFISPESLEVTLDVPHRGSIKGMGIPKGITLIVGGGYHGKSTLLRAIERGVYPHIEGDGREFVLTDPGAAKIRAEDGRRVEKVDISAFINNLPLGQDTVAFSTEDASGSTSQAANIVEALEMGSRLLLLDEDTSATNFMIRDRRMQRLVSKDREPITPFVDQARAIYEDLGVSTILVMGGSGDYFDVAGTVIMMDSYKAVEVTGKAKGIALEYPSERHRECEGAFRRPRARVPLERSFDPYRGRKMKIQPRGTGALVFGSTTVSISYLEQLIDEGQTRAIGDLIHYVAQKYVDGEQSLKQVIDRVMQEIGDRGLKVISPFRDQPDGEYAMPRPHEIAGVINRMRTLQVLERTNR